MTANYLNSILHMLQTSKHIQCFAANIQLQFCY